MRLSDFKYKLPEEMIARYPANRRDHSRLMVVDRNKGEIHHRCFYDVVDYLYPGDCLVVNDTRVFPARLEGYKEKTDARLEIFLLRELNHNLWEVLVKPARKVRTGNTILVAGEVQCDVIDNTTSGGRVVRFYYDGDFHEIIEKHGKSPLPPYIKRDAEDIDKERYQTVYARKQGAVAAPTAGLHFTLELLQKIKDNGVRIAPVTLHVGLGTFRPVTVEDLNRHRMDSEYYEVPEESARTVNDTIQNGGRVVAVGTSSVRTLETVVNSQHQICPQRGWTDIFIYPPYEFKVANTMITNFHLPRSTLLMLVSAFAGRDLIFRAYEEAIQEGYRFYSYGDAMIII